MQEETKKEVKKRTLKSKLLLCACGALVLYGGLELIGPIWGMIAVLFFKLETTFSPSEAASVGIIGGADGPTAIFITTPPWVHYILPVAALGIGVYGLWKLLKSK